MALYKDREQLIRDMERRLFLALCDSRNKGKELINSVIKDLEKLKNNKT